MEDGPEHASPNRAVRQRAKRPEENGQALGQRRLWKVRRPMTTAERAGTEADYYYWNQ